MVVTCVDGLWLVGELNSVDQEIIRLSYYLETEVQAGVSPPAQ